RREEELRESQERLALAVNSVELGIWEWDIQNDSFYGSPRCAVLHGHEQGLYRGQFKGFFDHVPREDRLSLRRAYLEIAEGRSPRYEVTYRVRSGDRTLYLESTAKLYRDDQSRPLRMAGVVLDITERVLREQHLKASKEKFSSIFQVSPDPISVSRMRDGVFTEVNPAFCETFGWSQEEIIGR